MSMRFIESEPAALRHSSGIVADPVALFFERLAPLEGTGRPCVLMVHGGSHSGSGWLVTADGRPGWAYDFVRRGYPCLVPDWPGVGRSGAIDADAQNFQTVCDGLGSLLERVEGPAVLLTHSMGGALGWRIAEQHRARLAAVVAVAPGPPGNIQPQPRISNRSETAIEIETPYRRVSLPLSGFVPNSDAFVDDKLIGPSAHFPKESRDLYAASLLQTASPLLRQRLNVEGAQVRVADPGRLAGLAVLVLTGSADLEHPYEADVEIVTWLNAQGAAAEFTWLADRGITGNGHMLMLERNSREIADFVCDWLDTHTGANPTPTS